jgi:hypothetical protein
MRTIHATEKTASDGTLTLRVPLGQPDTEFEILLVVQPKATANATPAPQPGADPWAAINAFRERLAASGRVFTDSTELIRKDRDR